MEIPGIGEKTRENLETQYLVAIPKYRELTKTLASTEFLRHEDEKFHGDSHSGPFHVRAGIGILCEN